MKKHYMYCEKCGYMRSVTGVPYNFVFDNHLYSSGGRCEGSRTKAVYVSDQHHWNAKREVK